MADKKCCCDCISCISTNMPFEVGVWYVCINPKGKHYLERSIYQWDNPCEHFMEVEEDG